MVHAHRGRLARSVRTLTAVAVSLLVLAFTLAGPAGAVSGPTKLSDPQVSPRTGFPTTTISFSVNYRNREGSPPDSVSVVIDGRSHAMTAGTGDDWKAGVRFTYRTTLALGSHQVRFEGTDRERFTDTIDGGNVTIVRAPTPTPEPTPAPTAKPAPKPTPAPTVRPTAAPTATPVATGAATPSPLPTVSPSTPGSGWGGTGTPGASGDPVPSSPPAGPDAPASPSGSADPAQPGAPGFVGGPNDPGGPDAGGVGGPGAWPGGNEFGGFTLVAALDALGVGRGDPVLRLVPVVVSTSGAVAMAMAFMFFGKKRRDGAPPAPDEVLEAAAARSTPLPTPDQLVPGDGNGQPTQPADVEALMPRWRRPSLLQARKADPLRDGTTSAPRLTFDHGIVGPLDGHERRYIRYTAVRLLDRPDELRSAEIGFLDQGDEVQLLERAGVYWYVLCPDGRQGWIHRMTLGENVIENATAEAGARWATAPVDADVDDDVLAAYLAAHSRS